MDESDELPEPPAVDSRHLVLLTTALTSMIPLPVPVSIASFCLFFPLLLLIDVAFGLIRDDEIAIGPVINPRASATAMILLPRMRRTSK